MPTAGPEATRFLSQYSVLTQLHNCIALYYALRISQIRVAVIWPDYFNVDVQKWHGTSQKVASKLATWFRFCNYYNSGQRSYGEVWVFILWGGGGGEYTVCQ